MLIRRRILVSFAVTALAVSAALAGAPLTCWKVETGGAASLPWGDGPRSGEGTRSDFDTKRLPAETLALLGFDVPVLARMETIRRAGLYAADDPGAGEELLRKLTLRAQDASLAPRASALAFFDAGYFVESWKQAGGRGASDIFTRLLQKAGLVKSGETSLGGASGYDWVRRAIEQSRGDAEMEYAAALITWYPRRPEHEGHLGRAAAGAMDGSLLARNILQYFGDHGRTLADLRAAGTAKR